MTQVTSRARRRLVAALFVLWVVVPVGLAAAQWPQWWSWIAAEQTPMTWLQSVVLVLAAAGSLLMAYVVRLSASGRPLVWLLMAAGFAALAVDERFALHERVRDGVLAPRNVTLPFLPWVAPGDFLVLLLGVAGLALLPLVWRVVAVDRGARRALLLGVLLAVLAIATDSIDPSTWTTQAERVQQTAEEIVELGSCLALFAAVALRLLAELESVITPSSGGPQGWGRVHETSPAGITLAE